MSAAITLVAHNDPAAPERIAERVQRLQREARDLAGAHIQALIAQIGEAQHLAAEIADGGEVYPAGVRDLARRFAEECQSRAVSMQQIAGRAER